MRGRYRRTTAEEETCQALSYTDPEPDGSADQLQHRAESEGPDDPVQSRDPGTIARRTAVGINSLLGERSKDRLPHHQRASRDGR